MGIRKSYRMVLLSVFILSWIAGMGCGQKKQGGATPGIVWMENVDEALALAKAQDKPLMIDFMATWCPPCERMEDSTFSHPDVIQKAAGFVTVRVDVDKQGEVADRYNSNASKYGGIGIPNILFLGQEGNALKHPIGYQGPERFMAVMDSVLAMVE